jgi:hypothetical protein
MNGFEPLDFKLSDSDRRTLAHFLITERKDQNKNGPQRNKNARAARKLRSGTKPEAAKPA